MTAVTCFLKHPWSGRGLAPARTVTASTNKANAVFAKKILAACGGESGAQRQRRPPHEFGPHRRSAARSACADPHCVHAGGRPAARPSGAISIACTGRLRPAAAAPANQAPNANGGRRMNSGRTGVPPPGRPAPTRPRPRPGRKKISAACGGQADRERFAERTMSSAGNVRLARFSREQASRSEAQRFPETRGASGQRPNS